MNELLSALSDVAVCAGDIIMEFARKGTNTEHKSDGSPVTEADRAAELFIRRKLAELTPDIPIIGEEGMAQPDAIDALLTEKSFWLVDPLDGTKEFLAGTGEYTVNIALIESGTPILGVVYAPVKGLLYTGSAEGAYRITRGVKEKLPCYGREKGRLRFIMSRSHRTGEEEFSGFTDRFEIEKIYMGSSLKFCMVAERSADIYIRSGTTMYWDSAAGQAVLKGAGAMLTELETGCELCYKDKGLKNPAFIATWSDIKKEMTDESK